MSSRLAPLAKAMGLVMTIEEPSTKGKHPYRIVYANGCGQVCDNPDDYLPNPFKDANADVAVLQWARAQLDSGGWSLRDWHLFVGGLPMAHEYKVGKFAESAIYALAFRKDDA